MSAPKTPVPEGISIQARVCGPDGAVLEEYALDRVPMTIGREEGSALLVPDTKCSRNHALIELRKGHLWYVDLDSRNGSFSAGNGKLSQIQIEHGTIIRIGSHSIVFEAVEEEEPTQVTEIPLRKAVSKKPGKVPTIQAKDLWEKLVQTLSRKESLVVSFGLLLLGRSVYGSEPVVLAESLAGVVAMAFASSGLTWVFSRLLRKQGDFRAYLKVYGCFYAATCGLQAFGESWTLFHPEGSWIPAVVALTLGLAYIAVLLLNLRWIGRVRDQRLRVVGAALALLGALAVVLSPSRKNPRWLEADNKVDLVQSFRRAPAGVFVPLGQFTQELGRSLKTLDGIKR